MRAYTLEIAGRKHEACEDSSFIAPIVTQQGETGSVYVIGDGLSGYNGMRASHIAVKGVGQRILEGVARHGFEHGQRIIREAIGEVNAYLDNMPGDVRTTLDVVLASEKRTGFYAHLGDGRIYTVNGLQVRQITDDETSGTAGPSNFLGEKYILASSIENRIRDGAISNSTALFMTSDGLRSRVSESVFQNSIVSLKHNPQEMLEILAQEVYVPRSKLAELRPERIATLYAMTNSCEVTEIHSQLHEIARSYATYQFPVLNAAVDSMFPFDDVVMIYIDFDDMVSRNWSRLSLLESNIIPNSTREQQELTDRIASLEGEITAVQGLVTQQNIMLRDKDSKMLTLRSEITQSGLKISEQEHTITALRTADDLGKIRQQESAHTYQEKITQTARVIRDAVSRGSAYLTRWVKSDE